MKTNFDVFQRRPASIQVESTYRSRDIHKDVSSQTKYVINVLVVVDTVVGFAELTDFGVGRFIGLLRAANVGGIGFNVDIASRPEVDSVGDISFVEVPNPGPFEARYIDFRFDSVSGGSHVLNRYDEVFLFGFAPGNDAGDDINITQHPWHSTDDELRVLNDWMNAGGGVFATGDHDYLGASMCHRIPRVGSMRKWTNADGVPPIDGPTRLDTNRPATADQEAGTAVIPNTVEQDATPQEIEWVPQRVIRQGLIIWKFPHRVLCHPDFGPIDVMPDHPHEGLCEEPDSINYSADVAFGGGKEYPTFNNAQPKPQVIAYGSIRKKDNHQKGPVNAARFPMISVYDGRSNGSTVGRVVVDSTWHHWFNMNIAGLENTGGPNWEKILRYYINVALWIAPPNAEDAQTWEVLRLHFEYTGLREINRNTPVMEVGTIVRYALWKRFGKCWTSDFILNRICKIRPDICRFMKRWDPLEELGWPVDPRDAFQPQFDVIEALALGHIYRAVEPLADKVRHSFTSKAADSGVRIEINQLDAALLDGIGNALSVVENLLNKELPEIRRAFAAPDGR